MTITFFHRLSYKLARTSLLIVLILGLLVTCGQIYLDFRSENQKISDTIEEIIQVSHSAARSAVHTLDDELAQEVAHGLSTYRFIQNVSITDEDNNVMASIKNEIPHSNTLWLTVFLRSATTVYERKLNSEYGDYQGILVVTINNDLTLRPLYVRGFYTLLSGFVRNIILGLILATMFHLLITRPLFTLAQNIASIDYRSPSGKRVKKLSRHKNDEIGHIVDSANELISHLEDHQLDLEEREKQLRIILDASPNQVFAIDNDGVFVFSNITSAKFYGREAREMRGANYFDIHEDIDRREAESLKGIINKANDTNQTDLGTEQCLTDSSGKEHVFQVTCMPFSLYGKNCILIIANDISARVAAEERVEKLAYYDSLTSLPNRNQLHEQLAEDIRYTQKHKTFGAVLFIDIDDFKRINDTLGHSIGDDLLLHLSIKMKTQLRSDETLARLGGDEFILSIPHISKNAERAISHAEALAERILKSLSTPIELKGHFFSIGASIGIATYPGIASDVEHLLRHADTAMYQAKADGRNCYRVFAAPMEKEAQDRVRMESEIRQGIVNNEFKFHLQPLIDAKTQQLRGAEALIRWEHPTKGRIMPRAFIPYLEQSPMMTQVGAQMLNQVCEFLVETRDANELPPGFRISVNVSATEFFQPDFVYQIQSILDRHKIEGKYVELEITETVALEGFENLIKKMLDIKSVGVTFALDDFGTGFSSLNYLKKLPVDKIKIDKSFIDGVPSNTQDTSLVASVIDIAKNLNLKTVVEGVETEIQAKYFTQHENIVIQGYWFDAPMPPKDFRSKYLKKV